MIDGTRVNFELVEWLRGEQMISRSPSDVQPVFDMIAESAAPLCDAIDVTIFHVDWNVLRVSLRCRFHRLHSTPSEPCTVRPGWPAPRLGEPGAAGGCTTRTWPWLT